MSFFALLYSCYYFDSFVCFFTISSSCNITTALPDTTSSKKKKLIAYRSKRIYLICFLKEPLGLKKPLAVAKAAMGQVGSRGWIFRGQTSWYRAKLLQGRFTSAQQLGNSGTWPLGRFDNLVTWQLGFLADWHIGSLATCQLDILAARQLDWQLGSAANWQICS